MDKPRCIAEFPNLFFRVAHLLIILFSLNVCKHLSALSVQQCKCVTDITEMGLKWTWQPSGLASKSFLHISSNKAALIPRLRAFHLLLLEVNAVGHLDPYFNDHDKTAPLSYRDA